MSINVTKTFLPDFEAYTAILRRAWDKAWITNNGELVQELEARLKEFLGVKHLFFTNNGTVVLQMALKAMDITGEVITTPFSYVATTNAILWEGAKPVFVDIDERTCCIDASAIEAAITPQTQAILATHVYGLPCDVNAIEAIAAKHNLKVIYDGAHAFGCTYNGKALLSYGDVSTCSFHATKLFHTVEGGCIITNNDELARKLMLYRQFGHVNDDYFSVGINGKNSEFHAAMGLAVLPEVSNLIEARKRCADLYSELLGGSAVRLIDIGIPGFSWNYAYYPVIFRSEEVALRVRAALAGEGINARRYFYPSLNRLPFLPNAAEACPVSEDIAGRVLSLPFYPGLEPEAIRRIAGILTAAL